MRSAPHERRRAALLVACALVVAAGCADTDPTSLPSVGHVSNANAADGGAAAADGPPGIAPSTSLPASTVATAPEPSPTTSEAPVAGWTVPPVTALDATPVTDDIDLVSDDVDLDDLFTDDPTFDVEPLKPFEVAVVEQAAAPVADDTGRVQPTGWAAFDRSLGDALLTNGNTAVSVAVSIGGEVVHTAAFGARAPLIGDDRAETQDRFRIASISKPITAITLLRLVEDGVVGLDEPVGQVIADHLGITPSNGARRVTVRRLLDHTSGFGKFDTQFFRKGATDCTDAARIGMSRGVAGGSYRYSNMNFCVAGVLIEALTGTSYEAAAYEQLLTPLGLSGLRLANTFDPGPDEILHATTAGRNYMETLGAAGSWIATPTDLVTIMNALDPATPGVKPLQPATLELMKTPAGASLGQRGYGLGLISYGPGRYGHTGTIENTHAMTMNRGDGVTWAITVAGPYPADTPRLESIINRAFEAAGFIAG